MHSILSIRNVVCRFFRELVAARFDSLADVHCLYIITFGGGFGQPASFAALQNTFALGDWAIGDVWRIGCRLAPKMFQFGIHTAKDLAKPGAQPSALVTFTRT